MAGRGRGRGKVTKAKQEKNSKLTVCKNGLGHKPPKHIGKIHHHHHQHAAKNENAIIFPDLPFDLDKSDSDSLSLLSVNVTPPTPSKKRKKENIQSNQYISHDIDSCGICTKCGIEDPQNQLCSGEAGQCENLMRTSTQWLERKDCQRSSLGKKDPPLQTSPTPSPAPGPSNSSRAPVNPTPVMCSTHTSDEDICLDGQSKFKDDTVRDHNLSNDCKSTTNLDPVFIPSRHDTSPDLELWYLKSDGVYKIPAGKSEFVKTTAWVDFMGAFPHVCTLDSITQSNHWLGQPIDANLAVRCGTVDPSFTGFIDVCVFNKGQRDLIVKAGSPIAVLKKESYI